MLQKGDQWLDKKCGTRYTCQGVDEEGEGQSDTVRQCTFIDAVTSLTILPFQIGTVGFSRVLFCVPQARFRIVVSCS